MTRYSFDFISVFDGKADYRLYIDGRPNTRITANLTMRTLEYSDRSPVLKAEAEAFNAMLRAMYDDARAKYPDTPCAPVYRPRTEGVAA